MVRGALLTLLLACPLLAACGGDDDSSAKTTTAPADCPMSAAAARKVHRTLLDAPRRSSSDAGLVLREMTKSEASTSTDTSPDGRDIFVLVNDGAGVAGLRGTSGSRSVTLKARPGCGAVGYLRHTGDYEAHFTVDGQDAGSAGPAGS